MYTREVGLVDITDWDGKELDDKVMPFRTLECHWGKRRIIHDDSVYSRVVNPVARPINGGSVGDYVRFFHFLLDHKHVYELSVKNPGEESGWTDLTVPSRAHEDISRFLRYNRDLLEQMGLIAASDSRKDHYLEIKFRDWEKPLEIPEEELAVIEFREHKGHVVGYQVVVPYHLKGLFTISLQLPHRPYTLNHALWVPENFSEQAEADKVNWGAIRELVCDVR